jgi:hypothetical protein
MFLLSLNIIMQGCSMCLNLQIQSELAAIAAELSVFPDQSVIFLSDNFARGVIARK